MSSRNIASLALLAAAFFAERFGYYETRAFITRAWIEMGEGSAEPARALGIAMIVVVLGMFAGAGLSFAVGARATAPIGLFVATVGHGLVALGSFGPGLYVASLGGGAFRVALLASAAECVEEDDGPDAAPSPRRFAIVTSFAMVLSIAANGGASLSSVIGAKLMVLLGFRAVATASSGVSFVGTLLAAGTFLLALLGRRQSSSAGVALPPYRAPGLVPAPPPQPRGSRVVGLLVLAAASAAFALVSFFAFPKPGPNLPDLIFGKVFMISSVATAIASIVGAALFAAAATSRASPPPLLALGIGAIGAGLAAALASIAGDTSVVVAILATMTSGLTEPLVYAPMNAYSALVLRGRAAAFGVATVAAAGAIASVVHRPLMSLADTPVFVVLGVLTGLAALGGGVVSTVLFRRIHRALFE